MTKIAFIVSGLPASGKSTVGRLIAGLSGFDFLDKDDFLEALFEERGIGDLAWRRELSRQSDGLFEAAAKQCTSIVLVSHWRPSGGTSTSGTPTQWLSETFETVVEVHCACPLHLAVERFMARERHPGHCDKTRDREEVFQSFAGYGQHLPLNVGPVKTIDTSGETNPAALARSLSAHLPER